MFGHLIFRLETGVKLPLYIFTGVKQTVGTCLLLKTGN